MPDGSNFSRRNSICAAAAATTRSPAGVNADLIVGDYLTVPHSLAVNPFEFGTGQILDFNFSFPTELGFGSRAIESAVRGQFEPDGNDILNGNAGDDVLIGGGGSDQIFGGSGNDLIDGGINMLLDADGILFNAVGSGNAILDGGAGDDIILGTAGDDLLLIGGSGNDRIEGRGGNDAFFGGTGDDLLIDNGDTGGHYGEPVTTDTFTGGAGDDTFRFFYLDTISIEEDGGGLGINDVLDFTKGEDEFDLQFVSDLALVTDIQIIKGFDDLDSNANGVLDNADNHVSRRRRRHNHRPRRRLLRPDRPGRRSRLQRPEHRLDTDRTRPNRTRRQRLHRLTNISADRRGVSMIPN